MVKGSVQWQMPIRVVLDLRDVLQYNDDNLNIDMFTGNKTGKRRAGISDKRTDMRTCHQTI